MVDSSQQASGFGVDLFVGKEITLFQNHYYFNQFIPILNLLVGITELY